MDEPPRVTTAADQKLEPWFYRMLVEQSPDIISLHDNGGLYKYVSPSARTILGYRPEELVGRNPYELLHPEDLERMSRVHDDLLEGLMTYGMIARLRTASGEWQWLHSTARTVRDANTGEALGIILIARPYDEGMAAAVLTETAHAAAGRGPPKA